MYAEERQLAVAELVARDGRVSVTELAANFDVTAETVRRDLSLLEGRGLVRRVHGGALPVESVTLLEAQLTERDLANIEQKQRIAQAAVAFLPGSGGTVLLDAGRRLFEDREYVALCARPDEELEAQPPVVIAG